MKRKKKYAVADVLEKALALFGKGGKKWIQGHFKEVREDGENCFCSIGAIEEVAAKLTGNGPLHYSSINLSSYVQEPLRDVVSGSIISFNDEKGRTWPEVRKAFRKAINKAKKEDLKVLA